MTRAHWDTNGAEEQAEPHDDELPPFWRIAIPLATLAVVALAVGAVLS